MENSETIFHTIKESKVEIIDGFFIDKKEQQKYIERNGDN